MTQNLKDSHSGNEVIIAVGSKDTAAEDIHILSREWSKYPEVDIAAGKDIKARVVEHASALFLNPDLVLVLVDPDRETLHDVKKQILSLKERAHVIVYLTAPAPEGHRLIEGKTIVLEQKKERRIEERVRAFIRKHDKKMTHQALQLLTNRIKDESILEMELEKLVTYVGERGEIRSKDILAVGTETHEESLITLFDAYARKDTKGALAIFENLLSNGLPVLAVHSFLTKQIRLLLHAKDMEEIFAASSEFGVFSKPFTKWKDGMEIKPLEKKQYLPFQKPYYAFNLSKTSRKISKRELIAFLDMLAALDLSIKSGSKFDRVRLEEGLIGS